MAESKKTTKKTQVRKTQSAQRNVVGKRRSTHPEIPAIAPIAVSAVRASSAASFAVNDGFEPEAQTIIYVHGIGNKPPASVLKCQWDSALFGVELGDRSRLAYWVNREFYPTPSDDTCDEENPSM